MAACLKLAISGVTFQVVATTSSGSASLSGRQPASEIESTARGMRGVAQRVRCSSRAAVGERERRGRTAAQVDEVDAEQRPAARRRRPGRRAAQKATAGTSSEDCGTGSGRRRGRAGGPASSTRPAEVTTTSGTTSPRGCASRVTADAGQHHDEQRERQRARGKREDDQEAEPPPECPVAVPRALSRASAAPSAKGNAAERTVPAQTTANVRLDQRAVRPHSWPTTTAKPIAAAVRSTRALAR